MHTLEIKSDPRRPILREVGNTTDQRWRWWSELGGESQSVERVDDNRGRRPRYGEAPALMLFNVLLHL